MRALYRFRPVLYTPAAVLIVAACTTGPTETPSPEQPGSPSPTAPSSQQQITVMPPPPELVSDVIDARTVRLSNGVEARILGLAPAAECWSATALEFTKDTLLNKQVRYSRASESVVSLRLATTNDDFSSLAVGKGAARAEKDDLVLVEAEKAAEKARLGLWAAPCMAPTTTTPPPPPPATTTTPPAPPAEKKDCAVTYRVAREWPGGFHVEIIVRNTTPAALPRWVLYWKFPGGQKVGQTWNAAVHQRGADVVAVSQTPIDAGATVSFRFNAEGATATPNSFALNGKSCSLG